MAVRPPTDEVTVVHHPALPTPPLPTPARTADASGWANLGWWIGAAEYRNAAEALARRVGAACHLAPTDVVVDYACGFGDSLRLWVEAFGVRRVIGVEPDARTVRVAQARAEAWGLSERIELVTGRAEDLRPRQLAADVTAVVCVDAAYHFRTRAAWLANVAADLPSGGRLAWSDLTVRAAAPSNIGVRAAARLVGIPRANLADADALRAVAIDAGLGDVVMESCGKAVLDGFAQAQEPRGINPRLTRWLLRRARRRGIVDYVVASARR